MVFFGCFFLGGDPAEPGQKAHAPGKDTEHPSRAGRLGRAWARQHPFVKLTVLITLCAGALLFYRIAKWYHPKAHEFWCQTGIKSGLTDGLYDSLIIIILYLIARVPRPPRGLWAVSQGQAGRSQARTFALALILGIPFGLAWGLSELWKGQHQGAPLIPVQLALTGLITGIDFTMGAWLFQWSGTWSRSGRTASPRAAARADLVGALLRPLILGFTFAFAFGISPPFDFTGYYVWVWFVVGVALGSLETEWPLYFTALMTLRRRRKRKLPIRLTRFLECCRVRGLLQSVGQAYRIEDDGLLEHLVRPASQPGDQIADHQDGQVPDRTIVAISPGQE